MRVFLPAIALLLSSTNAIDNKVRFLEAFRTLNEYYDYYYYDDYYYEDDGSSTVNVVDSSRAANVDGRCTCEEDTQIIIDRLENSTALSEILVQITDNLLLNQNVFIFNHDQDELLSNFDSVCKGAGGMTVLAKLRIAQCKNFEHDYQGYPNCISKTCGGTKITAEVVKDMLLQGLGLEFDESCTPEVSFRYCDYNSTFNCGQDVTGLGQDDTIGGDDDGGDDDGGGAREIFLVDTLLTSGQDKACIYDFIAMLQQPADVFTKAANLMVLKDSTSNSAYYQLNNNETALSLYAEECTMYEGEIDIIDLLFDKGCFNIEGANMTYAGMNMCTPKSCEDTGVEIILKTVIEDGQLETCDIGVSVVPRAGGTQTMDAKTTGSKNTDTNNPNTNTADTDTTDTNTTDTSIEKQKSSKKFFKIASKKSFKIAPKKVKKMKKKKGKLDDPADRSKSLKCVADMAIIHGNELGMNPYVSRTFVTNYMVECTPSTDSCIYNRNATALAQFNIDCGGKNGRVVQSRWLFPDGCDGRDDGDFINRIGVHDCVATTCSDAEAVRFFNIVYFDPNDTSCYADVSIASMIPAITKTNKIKKANPPKARRNRAV